MKCRWDKLLTCNMLFSFDVLAFCRRNNDKKATKNCDIWDTYNIQYMNAAAIRDKLYDYIRIADDKKIKAIYMMLEDDITEETEWWNNPAFVAELEKEYDAWDAGKEKGYSFAEIKAEISKRRAKKHGR